MKTFWSNLNERERLMLGVGGAFCGLYLLYALIYAPIADGLRKRAKDIQTKQALLVWMKTASREQQAATHGETLSSSKLLTLLTTQLNNTSFKGFPYQLQQTGTGDIQLSFEAVPYNLFVTWLSTIQHRYAFIIKQVTIERLDTPGVVKATTLVVTH